MGKEPRAGKEEGGKPKKKKGGLNLKILIHAKGEVGRPQRGNKNREG